MRHSKGSLALLRVSAQGSPLTSFSPATTANSEIEHHQRYQQFSNDQPNIKQCALPTQLSLNLLVSEPAKPLTANRDSSSFYIRYSKLSASPRLAAASIRGLATLTAAMTRTAPSWRHTERPMGHQAALGPFSPHLTSPTRALNGHVHGPGPGLPLEPTGPPHPPLQRPDRLATDTVWDPINIAVDHKDDPLELINRILRRSRTPPAGLPSPWGPDEGRGGEGVQSVSSGDTGGMRQQRTVEGPDVGSEGGEEAEGFAQPDVEQMEQLGHLADGPLLPPSTLRPLPSTDAIHPLSGPDLAAAALGMLPRLPPGHVAQLAVALARMGHFDMEFKGGLVEHVVGRMYQFTPQQLSDVAWAVASCGYYDLPFLEALAGRLRDTAPQWDARSLAKVLWAFGRFHFVGREPSVGEEALEAMIQKLQCEQDGSTIAEVVFAAGQLAGGGGGDWQDGRLQEVVAEWSERGSMGTFGPEALGKLSAGLVGLGVSGSEAQLVLAIAQRAAELAPRLEAEDICRVMELLSSHGYCEPPALEALAQRSAELAALPGPSHRLTPLQAGALLADFNALSYVSPAVLGLASHAYAGADSGSALG